jgi:site-specific DNA recombinase
MLDFKGHKSDICKYQINRKEIIMRVNIIQPKPKVKAEKRRVCAYARVSTEHAKQGESLENQIAYYEQLIQSNPEYEFVGVFADYGISGTTHQRPEFQRMLELTKNGQIDLIITKSVSRFARNTTILLETVRELKLKGIGIKFEKENISTLSGDGELMLTVLASFAQEESKNISDNIKWRIRNDFKNGKIMINEKRFLGYDKDENGNLVINEVEASIVRKIFTLYLSGKSSVEIAKILSKEGIKTVTGKDKWGSSSVNYILKNEKYKGDVINQKTYKPTHLKGNTVMNDRQVNQYYIKEHHEPIITEKMWNRAQEIMEENRRKKNIEKSRKYQKRYPYSGILYCRKMWR